MPKIVYRLASTWTDLITPPIPFFSSAMRKSSALGAVLAVVFPPWCIISVIWLCWDKQQEVTEPTAQLPVQQRDTAPLNLALSPLRFFYSHYRGTSHAYAVYDPHTVEEPGQHPALLLCLPWLGFTEHGCVWLGKVAPHWQDRLHRWETEKQDGCDLIFSQFWLDFTYIMNSCRSITFPLHWWKMV